MEPFTPHPHYLQHEVQVLSLKFKILRFSTCIFCLSICLVPQPCSSDCFSPIPLALQTFSCVPSSIFFLLLPWECCFLSGITSDAIHPKTLPWPSNWVSWAPAVILHCPDYNTDLVFVSPSDLTLSAHSGLAHCFVLATHHSKWRLPDTVDREWVFSLDMQKSPPKS